MCEHSMTEVEIESFQSQHGPDTDMYQPDSGNCAMADSRGLYPRTNLVLERGSQQRPGHACDQRSGERYKPPASPADSKSKHWHKDAIVRSRVALRACNRRGMVRSMEVFVHRPPSTLLVEAH